MKRHLLVLVNMDPLLTKSDRDLQYRAPRIRLSIRSPDLRYQAPDVKSSIRSPNLAYEAKTYHIKLLVFDCQYEAPTYDIKPLMLNRQHETANLPYQAPIYTISTISPRLKRFKLLKVLRNLIPFFNFNQTLHSLVVTQGENSEKQNAVSSKRKMRH